MTNSEIGMMIYSARLDRRMSGVELARLIGVNQSTLSRIESGRYRVTPRLRPTLEAVLGIRLGHCPKVTV